jgi:ubiquinone biosynthesis protein Coq4
MGLGAELVVSRKIEDNWDRPLKDWRKELRLPIETEN